MQFLDCKVFNQIIIVYYYYVLMSKRAMTIIAKLYTESIVFYLLYKLGLVKNTAYVFQAFTLSRSTSLTRSKRDNNNYQDEICQPRLPDSSTLSSQVCDRNVRKFVLVSLLLCLIFVYAYFQDTFLSNIGLIKKDRLEEITFLQSRQPRRRLRRLRVPLYHMPLELLPALVARGVINPAQLEYNPGANQEKKKRRKKPISQ